MEGNVDPVRDIEIIHEELRLKDEEMIAPIIDKLEKTAVRGGDKKLKPEYVSKAFAVRLVDLFIYLNEIVLCTQLNLHLFASGYYAEDKKLGGRREETHQVLP